VLEFSKPGFLQQLFGFFAGISSSCGCEGFAPKLVEIRT